jgi:exopolysaccharide biosynthesis WecB/TagA/CpsF family protein
MSLKIERKNLFNIKYAIGDYSLVSDIIIEKAQRNESYGVSALAVHGLIEAYRNLELRNLVNKINLNVPDGQPVRWALNHFHNAELKDRVYGPTLTIKVLEKANQHNMNVFLYGSTETTLTYFSSFIQKNFPKINICGIHIDRFREANEEEDLSDIFKINQSKANIVLVGRGCPRQEIWVSNHLGKINAVMMAVGAAFDFHAGTVKQAPKWMQDNGLEWLFRLVQEPRRLWKRYLLTNSYFLFLFFKYKILNIKHE